MTNLNDTSNCPREQACSQCHRGETTVQLAVAILQTPVGVFCCTLCEDCEPLTRGGRLSWGQAIDRVGAHAQHLGIDVDQMARLMDQEAEPT